MTQLTTTVNGAVFSGEIQPNTWLLDFLRDELELTGPKQSCQVQVCGACTVLVDGRPVSSCCLLAADVDGRDVTTIEGMVGTEFHQRVVAAAAEEFAVQCGFCTPGLVLTLRALEDMPELVSDLDDLKQHLRGSVCRCTGYKSIVAMASTVLGVE